MPSPMGAKYGAGTGAEPLAARQILRSIETGPGAAITPFPGSIIRRGVVMRTAFWLAGAAALVLANPAFAGDTIKIGFVSTFSGPTAVIGNDMRNSFELALDHLGRKMDGKPVEVIYEDDGQKPDVGKQKTEKLVQSDKVDFIVGYIWSNVLLASLKTAVDSQTFLISANAGPSQLAGELCSPYVFSTSWQNDQTPQAMGLYMNQKGVKSVFLIGPNYAAGKDMLAGLKNTFKGEIKGEEYTVWPSQLDFSAELSKARASGAESIFVFYPGAAGVQFLNQYTQAGLKSTMPLYTAFTVDELSLPLQKENALGVPRRAAVGERPAQRAEQALRCRLPQEVPQSASDLLRRPDLRRRPAHQQRRRRGEGRHQQEGRDEGRDGEGQLQVAARCVQVRQQPHPGAELLSPGRGQGRRWPARAEDGRHHRRERPGSLPSEVRDEVSWLGELSPLPLPVVTGRGAG
ncbi:ABC-type branched-subunit amino acid transport system substrate-binding protein [Bradyrhizobium diazoefficiens]